MDPVEGLAERFASRRNPKSILVSLALLVAHLGFVALYVKRVCGCKFLFWGG